MVLPANKRGSPRKAGKTVFSAPAGRTAGDILSGSFVATGSSLGDQPIFFEKWVSRTSRPKPLRPPGLISHGSVELGEQISVLGEYSWLPGGDILAGTLEGRRLDERREASAERRPLWGRATRTKFPRPDAPPERRTALYAIFRDATVLVFGMNNFC